MASKRSFGRDVHGILLLDKRLGVSSNKALQEIRRLLNANKAGHTGSLDPLATGLLPLCFGEATKISGLLLDEDKRYRVVVQLGILTDTGDMEGTVLATKPVPQLSEHQLLDCIKQFTGSIAQVPPMFSALKHQGKKLYELARAGIEVERQPRQITIFELTLLDFAGDQLTLEVHCSKGTYIRTLAEDIGHHLGCGATVKALRRVQVGQFSLEQAYTLEQLTALPEQALLATLLTVDQPLAYLPAVELDHAQAIKIGFGQSIMGPLNQAGKVRLYAQSRFLGLGESRLDGKLSPIRLFNLNNY